MHGMLACTGRDICQGPCCFELEIIVTIRLKQVNQSRNHSAFNNLLNRRISFNRKKFAKISDGVVLKLWIRRIKLLDQLRKSL
mmetsp:Transcript_10850/g.15028  ORF Transcript_10850/g.15028 Transcript_10850/m.15028 type:complete len:83 (-) Transcript_10850:335-583(-)